MSPVLEKVKVLLETPAPVGPVGPAEPVGPVGPAGPVGPVGAAAKASCVPLEGTVKT